MRIAVAGIVVHDDQVLIGKKVIKDGHFLSGGWHIPGGHLLEKEDEVSALKREFMEETNLTIEVVEKITSKKILPNNVEVHWYLCKTDSTNFTPGDDLEEIKFVKKEQVINFCGVRATKLWPNEVLMYLRELKASTPVCSATTITFTYPRKGFLITLIA